MYADATYGMELPILSSEKPTAQLEQQLIDGCVQGDASALRALYENHKIPVYRVTARMLDNEADREDVVQEIFLQIFRSVHKFKAHSTLKTWIHRIALNVIFQHLRKKKHRIALQFTDTPPEDKMMFDNAPPSPEESAMSHEKRAVVQQALSTLAPKKRAVLILHDFEGIKAKEIAKIVGTSVMTVRTRLFYARDTFYQLLAEHPVFSDVIPQEKNK